MNIQEEQMPCHVYMPRIRPSMYQFGTAATRICVTARVSRQRQTKASDEKKPHHCWRGFSLLRITSLTITYFHTGCSTIIGAKLFHGPV
ncbi:hypothetical protein, partial [Janthinobacterium lividum]|uniref:hypothetical protein n=1 Tax=Janthinobacterium lividum TaxID=29581 RepID=UPI00196A65B0